MKSHWSYKITSTFSFVSWQHVQGTRISLPSNCFGHVILQCPTLTKSRVKSIVDCVFVLAQRLTQSKSKWNCSRGGQQESMSSKTSFARPRCPRLEIRVFACFATLWSHPASSTSKFLGLPLLATIGRLRWLRVGTICRNLWFLWCSSSSRCRLRFGFGRCLWGFHSSGLCLRFCFRFCLWGRVLTWPAPFPRISRTNFGPKICLIRWGHTILILILILIISIMTIHLAGNKDRSCDFIILSFNINCSIYMMLWFWFVCKPCDFLIKKRQPVVGHAWQSFHQAACPPRRPRAMAWCLPAGWITHTACWEFIHTMRYRYIPQTKNGMLSWDRPHPHWHQEVSLENLISLTPWASSPGCRPTRQSEPSHLGYNYILLSASLPALVPNKNKDWPIQIELPDSPFFFCLDLEGLYLYILYESHMNMSMVQRKEIESLTQVFS